MTGITHGTNAGFRNWHCHCDPCTTAHLGWLDATRAARSAQRREQRRRRDTGEPPPGRPPRVPAHGTASEYNNYGCRCDPCTTAIAAAHARRIAGLPDRSFAEVPHGTRAGWREWKCACQRCEKARLAAAARRKGKPDGMG